MAAPIKPCEISGVNQRDDQPFTGTNFMSSNPPTSIPIGGGGAQASQAQGPPPPIPSRPSSTPMTSTLNRYSYGGGYAGGYGGMGMGTGMGTGYGMYNNPYSSYGGYGMNRYGNNSMMGDNQGTFARHAEESSRPAFESIESIVNAFTSVSMMLDSTFQAVYNSFRAVIGVADNFSRLKTQLMQVISALAFIRTLKYMYRRLLEMLRLRPPGTAVVEWNQAFAAAARSASGNPEAKKSSLPILMFFGIILGGPWLIWKLIASFASSTTNTASWADGQEDHFVADVLYDFVSNSSEEITVKSGQRINVAPKELQPRVRGWLFASNTEGQTGLIPANYVKVLGKRRGQRVMAAVESCHELVNENPIQPTDSVLNIVENERNVTENDMDQLFNEDNQPHVSPTIPSVSMNDINPSDKENNATSKPTSENSDCH